MTFLRRRLTDSEIILVTLLAVTLLAGRVSDRLGVDALVAVAVDIKIELSGVVIWTQRAVIALALLLSLLGRRGGLWHLSVVTVGLVSVGLVVGVVALIVTLPRRPPAAALDLLSDGAMLWLMTVLVFGAWYWLIDTESDLLGNSPGTRPDLLFPQQASDLPGWSGWHPGPLDYLFVAFTASTAFSPTDTVFLSGRVKLLMMLQAAMSLLIIAVILARAVNVIQ